jgi:hypothetical protein
MLHNYETGEPIRPATLEELEQSVRAARVDGGRGVFELDGVRHFVTGEEMFDWSVRVNDAPRAELAVEAATAQLALEEAFALLMEEGRDVKHIEVTRRAWLITSPSGGEEIETDFGAVWSSALRSGVNVERVVLDSLSRSFA